MNKKRMIPCSIRDAKNTLTASSAEVLPPQHTHAPKNGFPEFETELYLRVWFWICEGYGVCFHCHYSKLHFHLEW